MISENSSIKSSSIDVLFRHPFSIIVLGKCYEVSDWRIFGVALGISEAELDRIDTNELGKSLRCQKAMFAKWLDHYEATWRLETGQALLYPSLNARLVARAVAEKHLNTQSS